MAGIAPAKNSLHMLVFLKLVPSLLLFGFNLIKFEKVLLISMWKEPVVIGTNGAVFSMIQKSSDVGDTLARACRVFKEH